MGSRAYLRHGLAQSNHHTTLGARKGNRPTHKTGLGRYQRSKMDMYGAHTDRARQLKSRLANGGFEAGPEIAAVS